MTMRATSCAADRVCLYRCEGSVSDAFTFFEGHLDVLSSEERDWLARHQWRPSGKVVPQEVIANCLTINPYWTDEHTAVFQAMRSGDRSAYWYDKSLKVKGCNPSLEKEKTFPLQVLPYGKTVLQRQEIPFGVLSIEAAVREIFGTVFCQHHAIPLSTVPLLVYEYNKWETHRGCAVVLATAAETRLESFLEQLPFSVRDVQQARQSDVATIGDLPVGSEQRLPGLNVWWWAEEKAKALANMHWVGGFRGVLNSNIGNDVLTEGEISRSLLLCDFDSFEYHLVPRRSKTGMLVPFLCKSFVEVILGSLPIIDFVHVTDTDEARSRMKDVFMRSSSLWSAYWRQLRSKAQHRGIAWNDVEQAADKAWRTDAVLEAVSTRILGHHSLESSGRAIVPGQHYA